MITIHIPSKYADYDSAVPFGDRVYLTVPFEEKDLAKSAGARWDKDARRWYYDSHKHPITDFLPWIGKATPGLEILLNVYALNAEASIKQFDDERVKWLYCETGRNLLAEIRRKSGQHEETTND